MPQAGAEGRRLGRIRRGQKILHPEYRPREILSLEEGPWARRLLHGAQECRRREDILNRQLRISERRLRTSFRTPRSELLEEGHMKRILLVLLLIVGVVFTVSQATA